MECNVLCTTTRSLQLQNVSHVARMSLFKVYAPSCKSTLSCLCETELRILINIQAATSFECDGCNHHASYHSMDNPAEDAILKKWEDQEAQNTIQKQALAGASRKRRRIAEKPSEDEREVLLITDGAEDEEIEAVVEEQIQTELVSTRRTRGKK